MVTHADLRVRLDRFFLGVEARAFRIASIATRNRDDSLDIVQDAMLKLAHKYADRPETEWPPLFYRILESRICDWQRRQMVRSRWLTWWPWRDENEDEEDRVNNVPDPNTPSPPQQVEGGRFGERLQQALSELPLRQQQVFLLRVWEGLDVAQTADAMGCSQSSVKTHLARGLAKLREQLEDFR